MSKQDRQGVRTPADVERKYNFGQSFSEVFSIANDARTAASDAMDAVNQLDASMDHDTIFNLLTKNGELEGIYRGEDGEIYINASYLQTGSLNADLIKSGSINADLIKTGSINADLITTGTLNADYLKLHGSNRLYNFANLSELSTFVENIVSNMSINTQTVIGVGLNFSPFQCFGTATITVGFDGNGVKNAIVVLISNARSWHRKGSLKNGNMVWEDWQTGFLELTSNPASPYYIRMSVTDSIASLSLMYGASRAGMQVAPDSSTSSGIIGKMYADKVTVYHAPTATTDATNKAYVDGLDSAMKAYAVSKAKMAFYQTDANGNHSLSGISAYPTTAGVFRVIRKVTGLPDDINGYGTLVIFDGGSYIFHLYLDANGLLYYARTADGVTVPTSWKVCGGKRCIWNNPSPTSDFGSQKVSRDLSEYNFVSIKFAFHKTLNDYTYCWWERCPIGEAGSASFTSIGGSSYPVTVKRNYSVAEDGVSFGTGAYHQGTANNLSDASRAIPLAIYVE